MSSVPGNANVDVYAVVGVLTLTAAVMVATDLRARRRAAAKDGNGAAPDDESPPPTGMDGEV